MYSADKAVPRVNVLQKIYQSQYLSSFLLSMKLSLNTED